MSKKLVTLLLVLAMISIPTGLLLARGGGRRGGGRAGGRAGAGRRGRNNGRRSNKNRQSRQDAAANREMNRIEERVTLLQSAVAERGR